MKKSTTASTRVLFIVDPLVNLNPSLDTSIRWMWCYRELGWEVFASTIEDFLLRDQMLCFKAKRVDFKGDFNSVFFDEDSCGEFNSFEHIHMRKDPPFDMDYVTALWFLRRSKARIFNHPDAILSNNEKISILDFSEASRPALVSSSPREILNFIAKNANGHAVIKPLNLFGGRGVDQVLLEGNQVRDLQKLEKIQIDQPGYKIVQEFDKRVFDGEVRVFTVHGGVIASCLKIPEKGNFLANTRAGATLHRYELKPIELERISSVASELKKRGLFVIGFDLIGGYISEINVTSPRLLIDNFLNIEPYQMCVEKFIKG